MKQRIQILIQGAVQGVGFRPFIYKLANELNLKGIIANNVNGVVIDVEGNKNTLDEFISRIKSDKPRHSVINSSSFTELQLNGYKDIRIIESESFGEPSAIILPDIAVCNECLTEMFDTENRRYLYPFINCTNCGPRFSIIESLPYDRPNTSMKIFEMCDKCREEYENPLDRRFHAQPIACPDCGPQIQLLNQSGEIIRERKNAITETVELINQGKIVALKGLGGFQLIVNAGDDNAVQKLRQRKHRDEKPFAVMFPSIEMIKQFCDISEKEEQIMNSPESPIVLLKKRSGIFNHTSIISEFVSPQNPYLGVMLPYTPLHHLLMKEIGKPVIATSGNISEEPMCIDENEAIERLSGIADYFLIHNRPIVRPVDDSVVRVVKDKLMILRRARGFSPMPLSIRDAVEENFICVGGHLKNTISLKKGNEVFLSQHIGDLENTEAEKYFRNTISDFKQMYKVKPDNLVHDLHPDYLSTKFCNHQDIKTISVQHHLAHIAACYEENKLDRKCFAVCWDGTGFGSDGTIWGGEFFIYDEYESQHFAQFRQFRLPGGDAAARDTRRSLAGILFEIFGENIPFERLNLTQSKNDLTIFIQMLKKNINCFTTSSAGRLFDAVSALLNICQKSTYEGQAAMMLEFIANEKIKSYYNFDLIEKEKLVVDWRPMFEEMFCDFEKEFSTFEISAKFHNTLVEIIVSLAKKAAKSNVLLTGGCFQNIFLLERTIERLIEEGFVPHWNKLIPTNDGGISFGQAVFANYFISKNKQSELLKTERV